MMTWHHRTVPKKSHQKMVIAAWLDKEFVTTVIRFTHEMYFVICAKNESKIRVNNNKS
jgi:hypothetical protein